MLMKLSWSYMHMYTMQAQTIIAETAVAGTKPVSVF